MSSKDDSAGVCPVDHKAREAWLAQARANGSQAANPHPPPPSQPSPAASSQPQPQPQSQSQSQSQPQSPLQTSCDSSSLDQSTSSPAQPRNLSTRLDTARQISTIPRALASQPPPPSSSHPANAEADTGADPKTGNWIYPSEAMFFSAMLRKNHSPSAVDMKTIVPIHNAVNERAWAEILDWEAGRGAEVCGGPKLFSFSGQSTKLTPRARWNMFLGYKAPFDRHDWVVDRCGERIDYVIDFYAGKEERGREGVSFYLDVRPKLNSWEGWRMRAGRWWGCS